MHYALQKIGHNIIGGAVDIIEGNYWGISDNISCFHYLLPDTLRGERIYDWPGSLNLSIKKRLLLEVNKFDETLDRGQDMDILLRLQKNGHKIYWEPAARVTHLNTRNSLRDMFSHCRWYGKYLPVLLAKHPESILKNNNSIFWRNRKGIRTTI